MEEVVEKHVKEHKQRLAWLQSDSQMDYEEWPSRQDAVLAPATKSVK